MKMLIEAAILHKVPNVNNGNLELSEKPLSLSQDEFWTQIIEKTLGRKETFRLADIADKTGKSVDHAIKICQQKNEKDFISYSKGIAEFLYALQTKKRISDGYLLVLKGLTPKGKTFCALLKLDGLEGPGTTYDKTKKTHDLTAIQKILTSKSNKVFKFFYLEMSGATYTMYAMDSQINRKKIASFWLTKFLQCKAYDEPGIRTRQFFAIFNKIANSRVCDVDQSLIIRNGIYHELLSSRKTISPLKFISDVIPEDLQERVKKVATKENFDLKNFQKKIDANLKSQIQRRKYILEGNIIVTIPNELVSKGQGVTIKNGKMHIDARIIKS